MIHDYGRTERRNTWKRFTNFGNQPIKKIPTPGQGKRKKDRQTAKSGNREQRNATQQNDVCVVVQSVTFLFCYEGGRIHKQIIMVEREGREKIPLLFLVAFFFLLLLLFSREE